jgi:hypothetical protein
MEIPNSLWTPGRVGSGPPEMAQQKTQGLITFKEESAHDLCRLGILEDPRQKWGPDPVRDDYKEGRGEPPLLTDQRG